MLTGGGPWILRCYSLRNPSTALIYQTISVYVNGSFAAIFSQSPTDVTVNEGDEVELRNSGRILRGVSLYANGDLLYSGDLGCGVSFPVEINEDTAITGTFESTGVPCP